MFEKQSYGFDVALKYLRDGSRVARRSWDHEEFVVLQKGYPDGIGINANTSQATGIPEGTVCVFRPYLMKHGLTDAVLWNPSLGRPTAFVPWTPSQEDVLAEDWYVTVWSEEG
jgi:hypothetical protein